MKIDKNDKEKANNGSSKGFNDETVWTYRGYRLGPSQFTTSMVHLFRGEVSRSNVWRQRLDTTTNWAVITTGAAISIAFANPNNHFVILLNALLVTIFLLIEARRYRYYELWSHRVRLMETDFFTPMLVAPFHPASDWAETLAESLLHPTFPISLLEAIGRRLRRNYLWIYLIIFSVWVLKIWLLPSTALSIDEMLDRASIGSVNGPIIIFFTVLAFILIIILSTFTIPLQDASGEILPKYWPLTESTINKKHTKKTSHAWFRTSKKRPQFLAYIITDKQKEISKRILDEMQRGATELQGNGAFSDTPHSILLCAITATEVHNLKSIVRIIDPNAFVIITSAVDIYGKGFSKIEADN